jgi:hypothetical protein
MYMTLDLLIRLPCIAAVKPDVNISLFLPDKKSIIIDKYFEKNEAISGTEKNLRPPGKTG